ncbi:MAG: AAA family ATPase [Pyrinomonadaceae bacterium]
MHIHSIQVYNYKSFNGSGEIVFEPDINVITGKNNSGKTALLEAIASRFQNKPHRNPNNQSGVSPNSDVIAKYRFSPRELRRLISNKAALRMPCPSGLTEEGIQQMFISGIEVEGIDVRFNTGSKHEIIGYSIGATDIEKTTGYFVSITVAGGMLKIIMGPGASNCSLDQPTTEYAQRVFYLTSNRIVPYNNAIGVSDELRPDTSNLPEVILRQMADNPVRYERFMHLVNRVLPEVGFVTSQTSGGNAAFINIRPERPTADGPNIKNPIEDCGTGVGQIISMLYVIEYMKPSAIIIDEPNSFLHPTATSELIRVFKENTQHQYFISTHAHEVFREVRPSYYTVLEYENYETKVERRAANQLSDTFDLLGISPFYDCTYWVEGQTEVQAFRYILKDPSIRFFPILNADVVARESLNKSDEEGENVKKAEIDRLLRIYQGMLDSMSGEVTQAKMRIVVDGEHLDATEKKDYDRRPDKMVIFLPRKMFENYLLHPEAIAHTLDQYLDSPVASEQIHSFLKDLEEKDTSGTWPTNESGSEILSQIFKEFSECKCEFRKPEHSVEITRWIMENEPSFLEELSTFLLGLRAEPQKSSTMTVPKGG